VIIQTYYPDHFCIRLARTQDFDAYYHEEIRFRRLMKLPPYYALANIILTGKSAERAGKNAAVYRKILASLLSPGTKMLGPAPAPLYKLKNHFRYQILLKDRSKVRLRDSLRKSLETLQSTRLSRKDISIDIDPYHLM
jgi:primosomal protein N' (replication factor Y)